MVLSLLNRLKEAYPEKIRVHNMTSDLIEFSLWYKGFYDINFTVDLSDVKAEKGLIEHICKSVQRMYLQDTEMISQYLVRTYTGYLIIGKEIKSPN